MTAVIHNAGAIRPALLPEVKLQDLNALVNLHLSAAVLLVLVSGGALVGRWYSPSAAAEAPGTLIVSTDPAGVPVVIGLSGASQAITPGQMLAIDGTLVMNPFLYAKLPYDPFKDFQPVSLVALVPSSPAPIEPSARAPGALGHHPGLP
mgnify:CR=1 FL=1